MLLSLSQNKTSKLILQSEDDDEVVQIYPQVTPAGAMTKSLEVIWFMDNIHRQKKVLWTRLCSTQEN